LFDAEVDRSLNGFWDAENSHAFIGSLLEEEEASRFVKLSDGMAQMELQFATRIKWRRFRDPDIDMRRLWEDQANKADVDDGKEYYLHVAAEAFRTLIRGVAAHMVEDEHVDTVINDFKLYDAINLSVAPPALVKSIGDLVRNSTEAFYLQNFENESLCQFFFSMAYAHGLSGKDIALPFI